MFRAIIDSILYLIVVRLRRKSLLCSILDDDLILLKTGKDQIGNKISVANKAVLIDGNHFFGRFLLKKNSKLI